MQRVCQRLGSSANLRILLLSLVARALGGADAAVAAPTWLPEQKSFGDTENDGGASAGMAPDGTVLLARRTSAGKVEVRTRAAGGALSEIQELDTGSVPRVVAGPDGTFAVVWFSAGEIRASIRRPGGTFSTPPRLVAAENVSIGAGQIALDGSGRLWIVYQASAAPFTLTAATLPAEGSASTFPVFTRADAMELVQSFSIGAASSGAVHIVYDVRRETNNGATCTVATSIRGADGSAAGITDAGVLASRVAPGTFVNPNCDTDPGTTTVSAHQVAVSSGDDVTALFGETADSGDGSVEARHRAPGAPWPDAASTPETVAPANVGALATYAGSTPVAALLGSNSASLTT